MCSLCRLPVTKNRDFGQILTLLGAPVPTPLHRWGPNLMCWSRPKVYTYPPNFIWMRSLCRLPMGKNHNFGKKFDILGGSCIDPLLPMRAKFGVLQQTPGLHLQDKFYLNVFAVSASGGQKPQFWANFDFLGAPVPFTNEGQMWCAIADPQYTFTCKISSRSVYSVVLWRRKKNPICAILANVNSPSRSLYAVSYTHLTLPTIYSV